MVPYGTIRCHTGPYWRIGPFYWRRGQWNTMSVDKATTDARRHFIGGSDARIIMGDDEAALIRLGEKSAARSSPRTYPAISSSSSGLRPRS